MSEYIEREAALESVREKLRISEALPDSIAKRASVFTLASMNDSLKSIPAADVRPVVLCRDCKRYGGRPWENNETGICARTDCGVGEDDFCSYGEKREEATNGN